MSSHRSLPWPRVQVNLFLTLSASPAGLLWNLTQNMFNKNSQQALQIVRKHCVEEPLLASHTIHCQPGSPVKRQKSKDLPNGALRWSEITEFSSFLKNRSSVSYGNTATAKTPTLQGSSVCLNCTAHLWAVPVLAEPPCSHQHNPHLTTALACRQALYAAARQISLQLTNPMFLYHGIGSLQLI